MQNGSQPRFSIIIPVKAVNAYVRETVPYILKLDRADLLSVALKYFERPDVAAIGGSVNIGSPDEFTIRELAEKVLALLPESKSKLVFNPLPQDDPRQRQPDIRLAKEKLGWEPRIKLNEGLMKTVDYFRKTLAVCAPGAV